MFELLFKYPAAAFERGQFVLLGRWPVWALAAAVLCVAAVLFQHVRRRRGALTGARPVAIWLLETSLLALVLLLLWHPAISVATLKPQQNAIAVLIDESRSMSISDAAGTRFVQAAGTLQGGLSNALSKRFQVRLYGFGKGAERVAKLAGMQPLAPATRIGDSLKQALAESGTVPLGAVVVLSDGADTSGGIDRDTIAEFRRRHIPVHTIGFGREHPERDIEIADAALPARTLADSRITAQITLRQYGFAGRKARISVRDGERVLASEELKLKADGTAQTESLMLNAGAAGPKNLLVGVEPLTGEENAANNAVSRLVNVEAAVPRILYFEGEPRWEFKFIRRAAEEDGSLKLVSILRTTQNKMYRQGISDEKELEDGFPTKAADLFAYQGLIIGSSEIGYFTPAQQELIREFANRRGGGILFLGGRFALSEGGWGTSQLAELAPVYLADRKGTFHRDQIGFELTGPGRDSIITRLEESAEKSAAIWKEMPKLANYNDVGEARAGAVVLMELNRGLGRRSPLLAIENYGRGRTAVFATAGSWRWKMFRDHNDKAHYTFWQQLLRHLVTGTPGQVAASTPRPVLSDETNVPLRIEVRDKEYKPARDVRVQAHIVGPQGATASVELTPRPFEDGVYGADWSAEKPGSYVAEIVAHRGEEEIGRDVVQFRREDGVAENFRTGQNRELLEKLASETGGRYYTPGEAAKLASEISYSEAGITTREAKDLWDMPAVFLLALLLRGSEWVLRRKWGAV